VNVRRAFYPAFLLICGLAAVLKGEGTIAAMFLAAFVMVMADEEGRND